MLKPKRKTVALILTLLALVAILPHFAGARGLVPCGNDGEAPCTFTDIFVLIARAMNWLLMMIGVYAVYKIIQAGFNMTTAMGNEESITKNKTQISNVVVGMVLALMSFLFINTVVNYLMLRGIKDCQLNLRDPLSYLRIMNDPTNQAKCFNQHNQVHPSNPESPLTE